ncbi:MAG: DNA polymerase I [Humidesulfovibrio sp.]|uniref:DNA polymerase I n=1 Tax=Humidesulfovibrio sp. TaxID=2910988 RepID=UPI002732A2E6|nr:DNA polymerase I [Humidesulfovibrio sp.]MDP2848972.1 DNA polymerase I [Humidesulfovibrio sp.]
MSLKSRLNLGDAEPLFLVDGTSFLYRGFYAYPDLKRSDGLPTNAIFIVLRILLRILREERPKFVGFFMDGKGPTFRHGMFEPYKAQRPKMPEDLAVQIEPLREAVKLLGLSLTISDGIEADDCIASLAAAHQAERPVVIVASDKDLKQCLTPNVYLWDPAGKNEKVTSEADFMAELGIRPAQWPDLQALMGDSSDNIPGLPGVGPKTALKVIHDFPTLEDLREAEERGDKRLPESFRKKLDGRMDDVFLYRELTRLRLGCCPDLSLDALAVQPPDVPKLSEFLRAYEFKSLLREIPQAGQAAQNAHSASYSGPPPWEQGSLPPLAPQPPMPPQVPLSAATASFIAPVGSEAATSFAAPFSASVPAKPTASKKSAGAGQLSLFGGGSPAPAAPSLLDFVPVAPVADVDPLPLRHVADVSALPDFTGRTVGLVPLGDASPLGGKGGFRLALDGEEGELVFAGPDEDLAVRLAVAERIAAPSLQELLRRSKAWDAVPLAVWFDLGLAAYLLNPEDRNYSFDRLRLALFVAPDPFADLDAAETLPLETPEGGEGGEGPPHPDAQAQAALSCLRVLSRRLQGAGLAELLRDLETPLIPVLAAMERRGVRIDFAAFKSFLTEVSAEVEAHTKRIQELAGGPVNVRSSQQLAEVLFKKLGLKPAGKTPGGALSTGSDALEKLAGQHPIVEAILAFRVQEKLRSTYLEPMPRLADASGRLHTRFNQLATATGRLSSSGPNLQNIPIRGPQGARMRACFVASPGTLFVGADYSQVELRVLAHFSKDPALIDAFQRDQDIHSRTAALLFDKDAAEVTPDERRGAKTINFGLIYGMGPQKLARELSITTNQAKEFIARYFEKLGTLKNFYEDLLQDALMRGYVTTLAGRRRLLPELFSRNQQVQAQARRQAINTVIQGSAADVIKLAMLRVYNSPELAALNAKLILQVHDELLLEVPEAGAPEAAAELARLMQNVVTLAVPLKVDLGQGRNWAEAH